MIACLFYLFIHFCDWFWFGESFLGGCFVSIVGRILCLFFPAVFGYGGIYLGG